ncbi:nitrogen permease regulator 2, partial [Tilletiopsis washingtonensis]
EQFLPRLVAVFWAVFHPTEGPKVVYQVPDGAVVPQAQAQPPLVPPRLSSSPLKDYLIPKEPLCGHLVTCLASAAALEPGTPTHPGAYGAQAFKVLAYPVLMHDEDKYARNTFIFNLAFVFDAKSDVRAYEPVVRKCARTLRYLEDSKSFLSSPRSQPRMYGLIEQLYEDLNSYCETFIALPDAPHTRYLDKPVRDAINLKLFPTYANPPPVKDWDVPVALLDLKGKNEGNWDLTMAKIFPFIDGVNHVKRIAQLADADLELTRQCMEHLLFYSCIITLDIFAFSNMYSLRPAIAIMAEDESIQRECGAYVSRAGSAVPSWPKLLQLYSALRPGITLHDWIDSHDVDELGIDVRRFVTFGVIKGFLRRVHRYPILLAAPLTEERSTARSPQPYVPPELGSLCDGTRPEDELCVRFGISWSELHQLLLILGRPSGAAGTG